jgi:hypothetical protein
MEKDDLLPFAVYAKSVHHLPTKPTALLPTYSTA